MGILHPSMNNLYGKFSYKNPFKIYLLRWTDRQNRHPDRQIPDSKIQWSFPILHIYIIETKKVENHVLWNYLLVSIQVKTPDNVRGAIVRTLKMFLKNVQMDITSSKIQKVPKPVSSRTQQNLMTATKILNLYFLIVTINLLLKLKKAFRFNSPSTVVPSRDVWCSNRY